MSGPLVVVEGMPGTGKTTAVRQLADAGRQTVGEYVADDGKTVDLTGHPAVHDDAHQANWLRKAEQVDRRLRRGGPVLVDRDWTSALAYAASIADTEPDLLPRRVRWAATHLARGSLRVADVYLVLDAGCDVSLARRDARPAGRGTTHPWRAPAALARLRAFYADPPGAVGAVDPFVATAMRTARWHHQSGELPLSHTVRRLTGLLDGTAR